MLENIRQAKLDKLKELEARSVSAYPEKSYKETSISDVLNRFDNILESRVFIAGRVRSMRIMGALAFCHLEDETGKMQALIKKDEVGEESFSLFSSAVDIGDFIEVSGTPFLTKTGEKTVSAASWSMLSKSVLPLPSEYYGIKDTEELLRKRYLDLLLNPSMRQLFYAKRDFWKSIRNFLESKGFLEVDTPALEAITGGADARPFITHHNALDRDFYLRISLELPLKRLLVGGFEKVFEIGRVFRNEGIDAEHLQDYVAMEFYWAYADLKQGIGFVEELYKNILRAVLKKESTEDLLTVYDGQTINWSGKWPVVDYFDEFKKETGLDLSRDVSLEDLKKRADELGISYEKNYAKGRMIDTIYKKTVRQKLVQPCFLVGHPVEVSPLAKKDPQNPNKVLRMQVVAGRSELGNGFSELNDPRDQRARFEEQARLRQAGDEEAQMLDEDFVEALEYGMPPAFGFGLSERLFAFIMDKSVRETVIFPPMKDKA